MSYLLSSRLCYGVLLGLLWLGPSHAAGQQRETPALMLNGVFGTGLVDGEIGYTGGVGFALGTSQYMLRAIADVHLLQPSDSEYSWEFGSSGPECRDRDSGILVDNSLCSTDRALTGVNAEAGLIVPAFRGGIHFGAGYRFGSGSTPYAHIGYAFNPNRGDVNLLIRGLVGSNLVGVQMVATLPSAP